MKGILNLTTWLSTFIFYKFEFKKVLNKARTAFRDVGDSSKKEVPKLSC